MPNITVNLSDADKDWLEQLSQPQFSSPIYVVDELTESFVPDKAGNIWKCYDLGANLFSFDDMIRTYKKVLKKELIDYKAVFHVIYNGTYIRDEKSYCIANDLDAVCGKKVLEWKHSKVFFSLHEAEKFATTLTKPYHITTYYDDEFKTWIERSYAILSKLQSALPTNQISLFDENAPDNSKIYIVLKGRNPGIYYSWDECNAEVQGYSGAVFKSFFKYEETEAWRFLENNSQVEAPEIAPEELAYAYIDGSYNPDTKIYGYGGIFVTPDGEQKILQGHGDLPSLVAMRNVAGEISGAMAAIDAALSAKVSMLDIYYDYEGIGAWPDGLWKAKKSATQNYVNYVDAARRRGLKINFIHVYGHSGIEGNEIADALAKEAVGLKDKDIEIPKISAWRFLQRKEKT